MITIDKFEFDRAVFFPEQWKERERRRYGNMKDRKARCENGKKN